MSNFYAALPSFDTFSGIADPANYQRLPDDWVIGLADVVSSTAAIENGRYKAVNLAGAAVISAVSNALGTLDFPYVFTGDGMACAVEPSREPLLRTVLAETVAWVGSALTLDLRGAIVPVTAIRDVGLDVRVGRYRASQAVSYAMFTGGGLSWAEAAMKAGRIEAILPAASARPDLSGLSCRFKTITSRRGTILSLIATPTDGLPGPLFRALVDDLLAIVERSPDRTHPIPAGGPAWGWPPQGWADEARLQRRLGQSLLMSRLAVGFRTALAAIVVWTGRAVGGFSPQRYRQQLVENTDFRKFEDGLMMTIDCTAELAGHLEARLEQARAEGVAQYGVHRQASALLTCLVPSPTDPGHVHFIDGASGGYARAAKKMKQARGDETSLGAKNQDAPRVVELGAGAMS